MENEIKWELVDASQTATTERLKVNGGWLYHVGHMVAKASSMVFVPEPDKCSVHDEYVVKGCQKCLQSIPYIKINE